MKKKRIVIIDGLNTYLRNYIVNPSLSTNGNPIGGLKGFLSSLQKLSRELKPDHLVIVWDGPGGSQRRKTVNKNYKEGRKPIRLNRSVKLLSEEENIKNKVWPLAMAYDRFGVNENGYPTLLELELSNECNLECLMCDGFLSSGIRKNRDKLPKLPMHYNDNFVEQLKEYIPHLEELRFNGGEPFLHKIVHKICMLVSEINPKLQINFATNGLIYNKRVKEILEKCDIRMNISIDGFTKETYEKIRVNSDWETLMKNFKIFWKYLLKKNQAPSVMVNPMRNNWWEMKDAVRFANKYKSNLWYNTVHHPSHLALHNLPIEELKDIHRQLKKDLRELEEENKYYTSSNTPRDYLEKRMANIGKFKMFVNNQVVGWINESR